MDTLDTTTPPVFRSLRLLGIAAPVAALALSEPVDLVERYASGVDRLPVAHALFLTLFAAAWSSILVRSVRPLPGRVQQLERHLVAAKQLAQAQMRICESIAMGDDYGVAMAWWRAFSDRGNAAWDEITAAVAATPLASEHLNVVVGSSEYLH